MKKLIYPMLALVVLSVTSCKPEEIQKEEDDCISPDCELYDWEFPSSVGSYWIYQWYLVDSVGNEIATSDYDTVRVINDTVVNGNVYAVYESNYFGGSTFQTSIQRDSSAFVVDINGNVNRPLFPSGEVIGTGFNSSMNMDYEIEISNELESFSVPAGTFDCFRRDLKWSNSDGSPVNNCGDTEFVYSTYYHPNLGTIAYQMGYYTEMVQNCASREAKLIEYYVAP